MEIADKVAYIDENFKTLKKRMESTSSGKKHWVEVKDAMTKMDSLQLRYMQLTQNKLKGIVSVEDRGASYGFGDRVIKMNWSDSSGYGDSDRIKVFFHEYGHHLDNTIKEGRSSIFIKNSKFRSELYKRLDADAKANVFEKGTKRLREDVRKELQSNANIAVQDTISSLTRERVPVPFQHSREYWDRSHNKRGEEFVANCNMAWYDSREEAYMEKYFPTAYQFWKDTVKEIILKKGV